MTDACAAGVAHGPIPETGLRCRMATVAVRAAPLRAGQARFRQHGRLPQVTRRPSRRRAFTVRECILESRAGTAHSAYRRSTFPIVAASFADRDRSPQRG